MWRSTKPKVAQRAAKGKARINYPLSDHERRVIWWAVRGMSLAFVAFVAIIIILAFA